MFYATIQELIDSVKNEEITYRNLHTYINLRNNGEVIKIPYKSILSEYRDYFKDAIVTPDFTELEKVKYRFQPKKLSYDLYGTVEIWSALLEINQMYSIVDFKFDKAVKVYAPSDFRRILNEVMILEGIIE